MASRIIRQGQIYINNVCNLTCPNCSSFNNLKFKGNFFWEDSKDKILKWRELVIFQELSILGGEPFSHPDLDTWVFNLREIFNDVKDFRITTNGTLLLHNLDRIKTYLEKDVIIECSVHDPLQWDQTIKNLTTILEGQPFRIEEYDNNWYYIVGDKIKFQIFQAWNFVPNSIQSIKDGTINFYNSDAEKAHETCLWSDCHYFLNGNLYKCVLTATAGLLNQQFLIDDSHKNLISSIQYANPFDDDDTIYKFLDNIENHCDQCSLCPEKLEWKKFTIPIKKVNL